MTTEDDIEFVETVRRITSLTRYSTIGPYPVVSYVLASDVEPV